MPTTSYPLEDDVEFARELARSTSALLLDVRKRVGFSDRFALRVAGDEAAQELIDGRLSRLRPGDAILSEEAPDDLRRLDADRVWIVDPLDGTSAFAWHESTEWAVHIALWERGELTLGVVARPATGEIIDSLTAQLSPRKYPDSLRIMCSRSRTTTFVRNVADDLGATLVDMSSAGVKTLAVLQGEADAYLHTGGQHQWDNAAPVAIALGAGLVATRVDGSPMVYNERSSLVDDLLICRPDVHDAFRAVIDQHLPAA